MCWMDSPGSAPLSIIGAIIAVQGPERVYNELSSSAESPAVSFLKGVEYYSRIFFLK